MNCIIIEDEKPAQRVLQQFIQQCPNLELQGVFKTAMEAQSLLNSNRVDLLFLDINLPLISGIALLKSLRTPPLVIITTAYSEFALESFELDVVDYLLKPFTFERFLKATNKAFKISQIHKFEAQNEKEQTTNHIIINVDKTLHKLRLEDVFYVASDKDYVSFFTAKRKYMFVGRLKDWESKLNNKGFVRVHKSYLINTGHIIKVAGNTIKLAEQDLPIGRKYRSDFLAEFTG